MRAKNAQWVRRICAGKAWGKMDEAGAKQINYLRVTVPFFPGILLSREEKNLGKWRSVFEKNDG